MTAALNTFHARGRRRRAADQPADRWAIRACRSLRRCGRSASTRRRLAAIELLKTMSVALITALLALPLGLMVAWCLIAVVNVKAFGWRLPFHVFPLQLIELSGRCDGGCAVRGADARAQAGAHAAGQPDQDFRR